MVNCEKVIDRLSALIDSELDPELRQQIEEHLKNCRRCHILHDTFRKVIMIAADERVFEIPAEFSARLHQFLDRHL